MQVQQLTKLKAVALAACSGLLLWLAFPPIGLFLLSFIALAPLLIAIHSQGFWRSFRLGCCSGLVFFGCSMFWLAQFVSKWTHSFALGLLPWLVVVCYLSIYFGLFAGLSSICMRARMPYLVPFVWAGIEAVRSSVPMFAFPWALMGTSAYKLPALMQPAWWGGVYLLSTFLCFGSISVALVLCGEEMRRIRFYLVAFLLVLVGSVLSYGVQGSENKFTVAAVQPGTDLAFAPNAVQQAELESKIPLAFSIGRARQLDLCVLPEGVSIWEQGASAPHASFDLNFQWPTVLGGQRLEHGKTYQSIFGIDGNQTWRFVDKTRLVPFGEYVPWRENLPFLRAFDLPTGDIASAPRPQTMIVNSTVLGPLICFEVLFEDVARAQAHRDAELFVVPSNDDWYQGTAAIDYLIAAAVTRAVENRTPLVRCAPMGPSAIIDGRGNIVAITKPGETTSLIATVGLSEQTVSPVRDIYPILVKALVISMLLFPKLFLGRFQHRPPDEVDQSPVS